MNDQTTLALYTCRTCGKELEYQGVGRPPAFCLEHRPTSFPKLQPHRPLGATRPGTCARCGIAIEISLGPGRPRKYCDDCGPQSQAWRQLAANLGVETRAILPRDLRRMADRYRGRCAYCLVAPAGTTDHVIPISRGGRHVIGNLLPACRSCNSSKGRLLLSEWRATQRACVPRTFSIKRQLNGGLSQAPRARAGDPETSHAAAASITPGAIEARILDAFALFSWLTDDELADQLPDAHPPTVKAARSRLSKAGVLVDTGTRRPSNRGRLMIVWGNAS